MKNLILLITALFVISCSQDSAGWLKRGEVDNKGSAYTRTIKNYIFRLEPLDPSSLVAINYKNQELSEKELTDIQNEYSEFVCFKFEIKIDGFNEEITQYYDKTDGKADYESLVSYYLFKMQEDLKLVSEDGVETPCTIYHFDRNYSIVKSNRFLIGFKKPHSNKSFNFSYDNAYLNIGKINFQISNKDLRS